MRPEPAGPPVSPIVPDDGEGSGGRVRLRRRVNGTHTAETTDADGPLPNGAAGLVAAPENGGSGGDVRVLFDDVHISSIR